MIVQQLSSVGGVAVSGVDLTNPRSPQEEQEISALYDAHGLVVWKGQSLTKLQLVEATRFFGGPMLMPPATAYDPEEVIGITVISTRGPKGDVIPSEAEELVGDLDWHTDQGYVTQPNRGKMLYAIVVPEKKGRTGFIDTKVAYDALPDETKAKIEGLHVIQSWDKAERYLARNRDYRTDGGEVMAANVFPDTVWPIVLDHPISGVRCLNVPPMWVTGIVELPGAQGEALAKELMAHVVKPEFQYWHQYEVGDVALWDNWRFLHAAEGTPPEYVRTLWSTVVNGGPALSRILAECSDG